MPAIKKKWMQTNMEDISGKNESEAFDAEDSVQVNPDDASVTIRKLPAKRAVPPGPTLLKGLDGEVLLEKRKRFIPPAELKLSEWLDNNLEKRTEETIHLPLLYKYYTELCQASGSDILDVPKFNRMVKVKFGKAFGVQATSMYKAVIKEKKMGEKKKSVGGVKMKDVVIEAINYFGNPWLGVRFFALKHHVAAQYPALQIDAKPKILKRALEMGTNYGYIELTKGIGMMGSYRLPGALAPPPKPKNKPKKESEGEGKDGEEDSSSSKDKDGEMDGVKADSTDKSADTDGAGKEEMEAAKPKKPKKVQAWSYSKISYSNPARVEDTFPLAITYQSAPKAAGLPRIRRYILEKYGEEVPDNRWRKCLDHGIDKGYWEHLSGSGMSGRIHLLMDDFDPNSEQLEERICAAIIACHDPKSASANQIKKYVSQYHPDFAIDSKPEKFKKALVRAVEKKMIKQLSGLGASGSFMLVVPFTPSPSVLAGEDDSDDEGVESDDEPDKSYVPRGTKSRGMPKVKTMEVIKPRKTSKASSVSSSRGGGGGGKKNQVKSRKLVVSPVANSKRGSKSVSKSKNASKGKSSSSGGGGKKSNSKKRNVRRSPSPLTDEEEEEEKDMIEYTPRKSQSRSGGSSSKASLKSPSGKSKSPAKKGGKKGTPKPSTQKKNSGSGNVDGGRRGSQKKAASPVSDKEDEDSGDEVEYAPRKSTSRGSAKSKQDGTPKSSKKRKANRSSDEEEDDVVEHAPRKSTSAPAVSDIDDEDSGDDVVEYTPRKSTSRGGDGRSAGSVKSKQNGTPKSSKKRKAGDSSDEEDEDFENDVEYTPRKSASRGGSGKGNSPKTKSAQKRKADSDFDDDYETAAPKSRGKSSSGKKKSRR